jgi:hypothetical protein
MTIAVEGSNITTKAATAAPSAIISLAWRMIHTGGLWAHRADNAALYVPPIWTLAKRVENWGMALEAWADRTGQRLGVLDVGLERATGGAR